MTKDVEFTSEKTRRVTVVLQKEEYNRLLGMARREERDRSGMIRRALSHYWEGVKHDIEVNCAAS